MFRAVRKALRGAVAAATQHLDSRDIIGVVGMVALGTGIGMVSLPAALITVGAIMLLVTMLGSLRG